MIYLAGIFITIFLFIVLISKKRKSQADKILAAWLFFTGLHLVLFYLFVTKDYTQFPYLLGVEKGLPLVHGPFLFLYTLALTSAKKVTKVSLLHFIPVVILYGLMMPFFLMPPERKIDVYNHQGQGYEWLAVILIPAIMLSGIVYVILSFYLLRKHKKNIESQFSDTEKINLNWLRYLIYGTSVIWIIIIVGLDDDYIYTAVVVYVFFLGYFGIKQVGVFSNPVLQEDNSIVAKQQLNTETVNEIINPVTSSEAISLETDHDSNEAIESNEKVKYKKSSLTDEDAEKIHDDLERIMSDEQLFKDPELTLGELAQKLSIHPNTLSQVINSFEHKNFYDYINNLRIEEFKRITQQPDSKKYTLLSLAFKCGFNSKTAFNRNFKKAVGLSPTEYLSQSEIELG
ncbi:helix-turn-helix transcriptional regulator [Panacibacter ginsenosidivorans]|uniref:Helix-turn-helix transcriptional regulator n=1 Tax=Panacibacter ginsenosidivorans TaxID=1813871 RepID=A0A5B8V973_9BACT|nr:AraC family transcriptional regulator [Panacibacter ginsenosidivorans]QEC66898.1 helix-turn-helix transcriptional regulator [Panacibacter ginsenosidivorans]